MNVEIRKLANGYMVMPSRYDKYDSHPFKDTNIYVFTSYSSMMDKLQEILEKPEPKDDK